MSTSQKRSTQGHGSHTWRRQAFLLQFADALRALFDPVQVQAEAARMLGAHLGVSRAAYAEIVDGGEHALVLAEYTDGPGPATGLHRFDDYGPQVMSQFRAGRTLVIKDVARDQGLTPADRTAMAGLSAAALIVAPLTSSGETRSVFVLHQSTPRAWTADEVALVEEAAERTRSAVERTRALQALQESEEQFRSIFENAAVGVVQSDSNGYIINVNQTFCQMVGRSREELVGNSHEDIVPPEYKARPPQFYQLVRGEISHYEREKQYLRRDGTPFWTTVNVSFHQDRSGKREYTINIVRDISVRKRAQDALQEELADNTRLQEISTRLIPQGDITLLLEEILDAAIFVARADMGNVQMRDDETGHLHLVASRGFEPQFRDHFAVVTTETDSACAAALRTGGRVVVPDIKASPIFAGKHSGQVMAEAGVCAVQSTLLTSRTGRVLGMISTHWKQPHTPSERSLRMLDTLARQAADLFDRHQSEVALRQLNETLVQRVKERTASLEEHSARLRKLLSELTEAEQNERHRIAQLVHDHLQQLLIAAKMRIAAAQAAPGPQALGEALGSTERLLDSAIAEARSLTVELRPPALYESGFISALHWLAGWMRETHRLKVSLHLDPAAEPAIEQGAPMLFEATRELLLNVVKHSGVTECHVRLSREAGDMMCLAVSDRGKGFDPARAGERTTSTGLGLFSINERLSVIGGELTIESTPGRTIVSLFVPLGQVPLETHAVTATAAGIITEAGVPAHADTGVIRILLADDHPIVREGIANTLNQATDLLVVGEAVNGVIAVELAESLRPDVVVLDVNMPVMNGIAAARAIKSRLPHTRIIGLSIHNDESTRRAMLEAGACAYVTKDAPAEHLQQAIRSCAGTTSLTPAITAE